MGAVIRRTGAALAVLNGAGGVERRLQAAAHRLPDARPDASVAVLVERPQQIAEAETEPLPKTPPLRAAFYVPAFVSSEHPAQIAAATPAQKTRSPKLRARQRAAPLTA